jgi:subtilisin family serine protease
MRRSIQTLTTLLIVALAGMAVPSVAADTTSTIPPLTVDITGPVLPPPGQAGSPTDQVAVMLELAADADQQAVEQAAQALGGSTIYTTNFAYSGVAISIPASAQGKLSTIPGVKATHIIPAKQRLRTRVATLKASPEALPLLPGSLGEGIRVGVIDSGIDYTHATFGGPGTPGAYDANDPIAIEAGSFPTPKVAGGYDLAGDTYDADGALGSATPAPDSDPLDCRVPAVTSTLNRGGHGTFVAALAAGFGVRGGATYTGPYDDTLDPESFDLVPGVAPQATLYAFKVFGCRGSTALLGKAVELAIDPNGDGDYSDRLVDVLNIAIGSPFGSNEDPDAQAVNEAVAAGVVVVVAVGDNGNSFYIASSPGTATGAISVGALSSATEVASFSSRGTQAGNQAIKPDLVALGTGIRSAASGTGAGIVAMDGTSSAAAQVTGGAAALLDQHPGWTPAQVKGALINTATPVISTSGLEYPVSLVGAGALNLEELHSARTLAYVDGSPSPGGLSFGAPWLISTQRATRMLTIFNPEGSTRVVRLSTFTAISEHGVTVRAPGGPIGLPGYGSKKVPIEIRINPNNLDETRDSFTPRSQGALDRYAPAEHSGRIQIATTTNYARVRSAHFAEWPELTFYIDGVPFERRVLAGRVGEYQIAATGHHIISVLPFGAVFGRDLPLLEQEVDLVKGYDYTFGVSGNASGLKIAVFEAQMLDPDRALLQVVNANLGGPVDVALDGEQILSDLGLLQATELRNISAGRHTVEFYRANTDQIIARAEFSARAGDTVLAAAAQGNADCLGSPCTVEQLGVAAQSGSVIGSNISISVPFQIFPKSASNASVTTPEILLAPGQTALSLSIQNKGARNDVLSPLGAQTPLVAAFELVADSPPIDGLSSGLGSADLRYVGITNNYSVTQSVETSSLFFATASYAPWSSPNEVQMRVYIDSTGPTGIPDGVDDFLLVSTSFGIVSSQQHNDAFVSLLYSIQPDGSLVWTTQPPGRYNSLPSPNTAPFLDIAPYNTGVAFQLVLARFLGLSETQPVVRYHIETRSRVAGNFTQVIDRVPATGVFEYNLKSAAVSPVNPLAGTPDLRYRPLFLDVDASQIHASVNPAVLAARGQQALLLLHLHNPPASQAEVVIVASGGP